MRLQVLHDYGGAPTQERRIKPGVYDADDERLFGVAAYLVANGHAVVIEEEKPAATDSLVNSAVGDQAGDEGEQENSLTPDPSPGGEGYETPPNDPPSKPKRQKKA